MKRFLMSLVVSLTALGPAPAALAAERTVTLDVPMSCATCPYSVKRTLEKVAGVLDVTVSYDAQTATVRYDDEAATVTALTQATAAIGFPSKVSASN
jgi:mercuric ion binding protein